MEVTEGSLAETIQSEIAAEEKSAPPPAPEPTGQAEPAAPAPLQQHPQQLSGMVPVGALRAVRQENQELKARLDALEKATAPKPAAPPDPKLDPVGYLAWLEENRGSQTQEQQTRAEAEAKSQAEMQQQQEVIDYYYEAVDEFRDQAPDFDEAHGFLVKWGHDQLKARGIRNPRERMQQQMRYEFEFVKQAIDQGLNPASAIYAKASELGWQGGGAASPTPAQPPQLGQQTATPPRDPSTGQFVAPKPAPRSLSQAPGAAANPMSAEALANMPADEFDRMMTKDPDAWRRAHGR